MELDESKGRCWKKYEPVPGKKPFSKGSCRPKSFKEFCDGRLDEWQRSPSTKTITIECRDMDNTLEEFLKYVKSIGNAGHTFDIVVDPAEKGGKKFEWDGDGSDAIFEVNVH